MRFLIVALFCALSYAQTVCSKEKEFMFYLNQARASGFTCPDGTTFEPNTGSVLLDCRLFRASRGFSAEMAANDFFSHHSPKGGTFLDRGEHFHITPTFESILSGVDSPFRAFEKLKERKRDCLNIFNTNIKTIGIGFVEDPASELEFYWTIMGSETEHNRDNTCISTTNVPQETEDKRPPSDPIIETDANGFPKGFEPEKFGMDFDSSIDDCIDDKTCSKGLEDFKKGADSYIQPPAPADDPKPIRHENHVAPNSIHPSDRSRHSPGLRSDRGIVLRCAHETRRTCYGQTAQEKQFCVYIPHVDSCINVEEPEFLSLPARGRLSQSCKDRSLGNCYGEIDRSGIICAWDPESHECKHLSLQKIEYNVDVMCEKLTTEKECTWYEEECGWSGAECEGSGSCTSSCERQVMILASVHRKQSTTADESDFYTQPYFWAAMSVILGMVVGFSCVKQRRHKIQVKSLKIPFDSAC